MNTDEKNKIIERLLENSEKGVGKLDEPLRSLFKEILIKVYEKGFNDGKNLADAKHKKEIMELSAKVDSQDAICQYCKENKKEIEILDKDIVDYFKGKDINDADRLLLKTAQNNFNKGLEKGKEDFNKKVEELKDEIDNINGTSSWGEQIGLIKRQIDKIFGTKSDDAVKERK